MIKLIYYYYCIAYRFSEKYDIRGAPHLGAFWSIWNKIMMICVVIIANLFRGIQFENKYIILALISFFLPMIIVKSVTRKMGQSPPKDFTYKFNFKYYFYLITTHLILIYLAVNYGFALL